MTLSSAKKQRCPTCGTSYNQDSKEIDSRYKPFCSKRCKMVDLGNWFTDSYRIPVPLTEEDAEALLENLEENNET